MSSKEEQAELGRLVLQTGIDVLYIKNVESEETANEHGWMKIRFLSAKQVNAADILRCRGEKMLLLTAEGETVFGGICTGMSMICQNQYTELEALVETASVQADQEPHTNTYQGTDKTLSSVLAKGMGQNTLIQIDEDIAVPEMLSQENETDWAFGKRICNQYGKQLFVNSKTTGSEIRVGNAPFQKKELGMILHTGMDRDVDKVRTLQGNTNPQAAVFEYEETKLTVSDLTLGAGYSVTYGGRTQMITKSRISCVQGLLQNEITLANEEGLSPSVSQLAGVARRSSILTGTVLAVDGTNVKVDFGAAGDAPRWIPYAHAVSNYFYSMPDVGDSVFVYYETGDSDKIVCLGSKHVNDSPDFARYQDKMLTADNRMVKFGDKTLNLVGNRSEYDGMGGEQAKIIFNDETGIEIQSTQDIRLETTDGGNITIQAFKGDFAGMDALRENFRQMYGEGQGKFESDGGKTDFDAMEYLQSKSMEGLKKNIIENLKSPFAVVGTVQELAGRIGGSAGTEVESVEESAPEFTDGIVDLFAVESLTIQVGSSSIIFSSGIMQVKADTFMQLGTDRSVVYEHLEDANYTWRDMILDVTQLALDVVGALPIPGVSTVANLVNAGISLARGDYVGAAISAGSAALSLIPGANTAAEGVKAATKGTKLATTAAKVASKAPKVMETMKNITKAAKILRTGADTLNLTLLAGMSVYDIGNAVADGTFDLNDPDCRQDLFNILQGASAASQYGIEKNTTTGKDGKPRFMDKNERKAANDARHRERQEKTRAKLDEKSANKCKNGEPVDMVTGSFLVEQCDFMINDITGTVAVERTYESLLASEDSPVGRGWTLSLFSHAYIYDDRVEIVLPDNHTETFLKTADGFRNRRDGSRNMELTEHEGGLRLEEHASDITRIFDSAGKQILAMDKNGNKTVYEYSGETLRCIRFASGQYLEFLWQGNKIIQIKDCIGRTATYHYDGDFLIETGMVTGGTETYAYDGKGHITDITDANGVTYVHNEYDRKGRVTRQKLCDGQEYILLYADDDRTNTYLVPANGKKIRYHYNKDRQLICAEYQDGTTEKYAYDAWENRTEEKDRRGSIHRRTYDVCGHMTEEVLPNGLVISYEYDGEGNCVRRWDSAGRESTYAYDQKGNLLRETEKLDGRMQREECYEYDRNGRVTAFTDGNGHRETYRYEKGFWEYTMFTSAEGSVSRHVLDDAGRCVTVENADGVFSYAYNNFDILCMETDPLGNTKKYVYDRVLDLISEVSPNHFDPEAGREIRTEYTYDAFHRQLTRTDETGAVFAVHRDGEGNIIKEIHPESYDAGSGDGEGVVFRFDADDNNTHICYPDGGTERRWYDAMGNLVKLCLPEQYDEETDSGNGYSYEYDEMGNLTQITGPDGIVEARYVYDLHGNLVKAVSASGMETGKTDAERTGELYAYNYAGWLTESRKPLEIKDGEVYYQLTQYQYDRAGNRIRERRFCDYQSRESAGGAVLSIDYAYDADDRLVKVTDNTGAELEYRYDGMGRRFYEKEKTGENKSRILCRRYDDAGRMVELARTADREGCGKRRVSSYFEYDRNGNNTRTILPGGAEIRREYDAADRLVRERHIEKESGIDNTEVFDYDKAGNMVCITDGRGKTTRIAYDRMNRETLRRERDGGITRRFHDRNGRLVKVIRPNEYDRAQELGAGMQYTYDDRGNLLSVTRADGSLAEQTVYDADGRPVRVTDGTGAGEHYTYDFGGRRTGVRTNGGAGQQYEYDAAGNVTAVTDGVSNRTVYVPDRWGRTTEVRMADGSREYYAYDYAGNITRSTDGEGNTTVYEYNAAGQLSAVTDPADKRETYAYDAMGRLCRKTDRNGTVTEYTYNLYGSITGRRARKAGEETALTERYHYTPEGLLCAATAGGMRYGYTYDAMGRLAGKCASGRQLLSLEYDLNGNMTRRMDVTGKTTEYHYDVNDRTEEVWDDGAKVAEYCYNADGTVRSLRNGPLYTEYSYDMDRNLSGLKTMFGEELLADSRYRYDGNGNRLEKRLKGKDGGTQVTSYAYDSCNRLSRVHYPDREEELFYDRAGNRTGRTVTSPAAAVREEHYRYDSRNRLMEYTGGGETQQFSYDAAGNLLSDGSAVYEYDAFNRNVKAETFSGDLQASRYDAEGMRHEMEENGKLVSFIFSGDEVAVAETAGQKIRYIRTHELLASDAENARTYYHYASDEMGSITHVVGDGQVLNRYAYDAWGVPEAEEETVQSRFLFNGQQYDAITRQYYLRARFYNPVIGRFTQEDSYRGDGLNLYSYCANNPVYYVDPDGHMCDSAKDRIQEKKRNGKPASSNEKRKNNKAGKNGQTPKGYYQDANGRWHRPNGQFASNAEVGLPPAKNRKNSSKKTGSYTIIFSNGKKYHGKGPKSRMRQSAKEKSEKNKVDVVSMDWKEADNDIDAFIDEHNRIHTDEGGPSSEDNYNKIESPGKRYLEERKKK